MKRQAATLLALSFLAVACTDEGELFPTNGTATVTLLDGGLTLQTSPTPGNQITVWVVEALEADLGSLGTVDLLGQVPCEHTQNVVIPRAFAIACQVSGYAFEPGVPIPATVRATISRMEVRRASRPDLPPDQDFDGDGVLNMDDNCDLIANPAQDDINGDDVGDACSSSDVNGDPTVPDLDADAVPDSLDNCRWTANPTQDDAELVPNDFEMLVKAGIGDDCEQIVDVMLPATPLQIEVGPIDFTVNNGAQTFLIMDFNGELTLMCDSAFTSCTLDPAAVTLTAL